MIISSEGFITSGQLLKYADIFKTKLRGVKIAINLADPIEGLKTLIAADGQAEAITLLPTSLTDQQISNLTEMADCDLLVSDNKNLNRSISSFNVTSCLSNFNISGKIKSKENYTSWFVATSGTTKTPKLVAHTLASLSRTVKISTNCSQHYCWGLLYDYMRFAGLQVLLQSFLSGDKLILLPQQYTLQEKIRLFAINDCTHISATPTLWRKIIMSPEMKSLRLLQITLGGEIADERILSILKTSFPHARITHIYASTEAGVGFSVKDGKPGFPSKFLYSPPNGLALRLKDGCLQIKNSGVTPSYVGTDDLFSEKDGWIATGDMVKEVDNRIFFLGRASGVINVGGNKVHPEELEQILLAHSKIKEVKVFGKPNPIVGTLVVADIVTNNLITEPSILKADIKQYLKGQVENYKIPALINLVEKLETNTSGKLSRKNK